LKKALTLAVLILTAAPAAFPGAFSAADVPGARIKRSGKIVIKNDQSSITAFEFFGDVKQALLTLHSVRTLNYRPFGSVVYNSDAPIYAPVPPEIAGYIREAAATHGVDPRLITEVARRESGFNQMATSRVGARGVMQLMPATAQFLGVGNPLDVRENILGATKYLRMLLDTFHGDLDMTLAAYNAGPGAVQKYRGVPPYAETMAYVSYIRTNYERALSSQP
jgi:soluble lytic murein transglycosylase-like protein